MSNIRIHVCGFCHTIDRDKMPCRLSIGRGKGEDKEANKSSICDKCFELISGKISFEFDINSLFNRPASIVPAKPTRSQPPANTCQHDATSFDPPNVTCKDCGEEWEV